MCDTRCRWLYTVRCALLMHSLYAAYTSRRCCTLATIMSVNLTLLQCAAKKFPPHNYTIYKPWFQVFQRIVLWGSLDKINMMTSSWKKTLLLLVVQHLKSGAWPLHYAGEWFWLRKLAVTCWYNRSMSVNFKTKCRSVKVSIIMSK